MTGSDSVAPLDRYVNSSAYGFCTFDSEQLPAIKQTLLEAAKALNSQQDSQERLHGTILVASEGLNIRLSGTAASVESMKTTLRALHPGLSEMEFKDSLSARLTLPRFLVKIKSEVISMGVPEVKPAVDGLAAHISPEEFKDWLDQDKDMLVLDTR